VRNPSFLLLLFPTPLGKSYFRSICPPRFCLAGISADHAQLGCSAHSSAGLRDEFVSYLAVPFEIRRDYRFRNGLSLLLCLMPNLADRSGD
jgi:hypothetical protein